jgi:hypothetical protein
MSVFTMDQVSILAHGIKTYCAGVKDVFVFGSYAHNEAHKFSDLDLIITVENSVYEQWMERCELTMSHKDRDHYLAISKGERFWATFGTLSNFDTWVITIPEDLTVDMFVLPHNWQTRLDELQERGSHIDPNFMNNIAEGSVLVTE